VSGEGDRVTVYRFQTETTVTVTTVRRYGRTLSHLSTPERNVISSHLSALNADTGSLVSAYNGGRSGAGIMAASRRSAGWESSASPASSTWLTHPRVDPRRSWAAERCGCSHAVSRRHHRVVLVVVQVHLPLRPNRVQRLARSRSASARDGTSRFCMVPGCRHRVRLVGSPHQVAEPGLIPARSATTLSARPGEARKAS